MGYNCCVKDLGLIKYKQAYHLQELAISYLKDTGIQTLFFCEHPVVITFGRLAGEENLLVDEQYLKTIGVEVVRINRGGDITLHAPGQLVIYPIFNLLYYGRDLRRYLYKLEQAAVDLLAGFGIVANRSQGRTGVWIGEKKIASIGVGVKRWISFHGIAININVDLELFSMIRPCGMDIGMTSIHELIPACADIGMVKNKIKDCFEKEFDLIYS